MYSALTDAWSRVGPVKGVGSGEVRVLGNSQSPYEAKTLTSINSFAVLGCGTAELVTNKRSSYLSSFL